MTDLDPDLVIAFREPLSHLSEVAEEPESSSPDYPTAVSSSSRNTISRSFPTDTSANYASSAWSPPSSISPNNYAAGLVYGVDIFDAVGEYDITFMECLVGFHADRGLAFKLKRCLNLVVIRTQKAMETFYGHKATLGADIGVVAGPVSSSILPSFTKQNKANFCSG